MKVIKVDQVPKELATSPLFTGGLVRLQTLVQRQTDNRLYALNVNFDRGARNKFHLHTSDQLLIVTSGRGLVATEQEEVVVEVGDVIHIRAGEKHWHGATKDSEFSHIAVASIETETTQLED